VNLDSNQLCGNGYGEFTLDGINAICDALTKSNVQSISITRNELNDEAKQVLRSAAEGRNIDLRF